MSYVIREVTHNASWIEASIFPLFSEQSIRMHKIERILEHRSNTKDKVSNSKYCSNLSIFCKIDNLNFILY